MHPSLQSRYGTDGNQQRTHSYKVPPYHQVTQSHSRTSYIPITSIMDGLNGAPVGGGGTAGVHLRRKPRGLN